MFHVKQYLLLHDLVRFLKTQNISLASIQLQQLESYYTELESFASKMNLVSARDKSFIIEHHFLPSFYYYHYLQYEEALSTKRILDLGTGAGFPGVVLAIADSKIKITLIDSSRKKTLFLRNLKTKLNLQTEIICDRVENLAYSSLDKYDIIVARAVADIPVLYNWSVSYLKKDGYLMTLKGNDYMTEMDPKKNIKIIELRPNPTWCIFSEYLANKRMIKIVNI